MGSTDSGLYTTLCSNRHTINFFFFSLLFFPFSRFSRLPITWFFNLEASGLSASRLGTGTPNLRRKVLVLLTSTTLSTATLPRVMSRKDNNNIDMPGFEIFIIKNSSSSRQARSLHGRIPRGYTICVPSLPFFSSGPATEPPHSWS